MKKHVLPLIMISLLILAWIIAFPMLPEQIPIHWGLNGEANGFASKINAMFSTLGVMVILYLAMALLPKVDPRKTNYKFFSKSYHILINAILGVLFVINILVLASAIGFDVPMGSIGSMIIGIIFMILGNYLPHVRSNFFIGIRTPWTLSSEEVWKQTHRALRKSSFLEALY